MLCTAQSAARCSCCALLLQLVSLRQLADEPSCAWLTSAVCAVQALVQVLGQSEVAESTRGQVAGVLKGLQASNSQLLASLSSGDRSALSDLTNH